MTPWRFTLLGYQLAFHRPIYFAALGACFLIGVLAIALAARRRLRVHKVIPERLEARLAPGVSVARPVLRSIFSTASLTLMAIALAQPQCGSKAELTKRRGVDVVVALDASKSMLARDVQPSRLDRAKLELSTLLDELKGDRVAIVVFSQDAFVQCPLTSDYAAAKMFLRAIDPDAMPQGGTNIGGALSLAQKVLTQADRGAKDKVVVLISDGEDLTGDIAEGIESLTGINARVLAVGVGGEQGEPIPILNKTGDIVGYKKDASGATVLTRMDKSGLEKIADETSGQFFHRPQGVAMDEVVKLIDQMQKSELESRLMLQYAEGFQYFVFAAVMFLILALMIAPSGRKVTA